MRAKRISGLMRLLDDSRVDVQELPLPSGTVADDFKDGAPRDVLYARLMDYLVRRSNVLVALWDGEVTGLTGGSSDVLVRYLTSSEPQARQTRKLEAVGDAELADDRSDLAIWIEVHPSADGEIEQGRVQTSYLVQAGATGLICRLPHIPDFVMERWSEFDQYRARTGHSETGTELTTYPISTADDIKISEVATVDRRGLRSRGSACPGEPTSIGPSLQALRPHGRYDGADLSALCEDCCTEAVLDRLHWLCSRAVLSSLPSAHGAVGLDDTLRFARWPKRSASDSSLSCLAAVHNWPDTAPYAADQYRAFQRFWMDWRRNPMHRTLDLRKHCACTRQSGSRIGKVGQGSNGLLFTQASPVARRTRAP